jgi:uncharacterized membrane protein
MKDFLSHARSYIFRGLLAIIPLYLSYLAVKFIYILIDRPVATWFFKFTGLKIYGIGVVALILILYFTGLLVSNVIGKRLFGVIEKIFNRIPILKTTYQVGKQVSDTFSLSEKQAFQKAVVVNLVQSGLFVIGFVTGEVVDQKTGTKLAKIFIPTVPNPTTGFVVLVKEDLVMDPGWTVDEAVKLVISAGLIGTEKVKGIA